MALDENRIKNIFWTVSSGYEYDLSNFSIKAKDFYEAALLGFASKYYDFYTVNDFFKSYLNGLNNKDELLEIAKITMENVYNEDLLEDRNGVIDFKKTHDENILKKLKRQKILLIDELKIGFIRAKKNEYPKIQKVLNEMLKEILSFHSIDTFEYLEFLKNLYNKYFHINKSLNIDVDKEFKEFKEKTKKKRNSRSKKYNSKVLDNTFLERYNIESAEFTFFNDDYRDVNIIEDDLKNKTHGDINIYERTLKRYGVEKIPRYISDKIAAEISTGIHRDIKLFFPSGEYENKDSYYAREAESDYEDNLHFYKENELANKRAIRELSIIIKNSLLKESSDEIVRSNSGSIIPNEIWKTKKLNEDRVFQKINKNDSSDIYVDILLDSSASQNERKEIVATESYIIAEALTSLNIKTRVFSYNNFYNYLVIKKYRDYKDSRNKNREIFKYSPSGSNRDGLAFKFMRHLSEKNLDEKRFLIVLTDGLPFDEIDVGLVGGGKVPGENYKDEDALMDSSKEILLTRLKNINTFGVFTGNESEIGNIKKIFGNDFAYITDISRFHKVVGVFLKTYAQKIE